ncbi:NAD(P)-dependent glycerol-1-phosphate dehydrogenase [Methanocella sp. CWC-04]|uniref:Glycerol-1-phosphate dehydrogenase [NAD(P)+] n=2 Tax=Methanooceanicella nereidis TaxID=2052831 RepID=A0AAP2RBW3_9EURY|nr:NAD(P)-dependent glycerol-1-phosphate dehydrogenase [Methanocella sp. CWC-04]
MQLPRNVIAGPGAIDSVGGICQSMRLKGRSLIVTGKNTKKIAGDIAAESLRASGYDVDFVIVENATIDNVDNAKAVAKEVNADFLVGVGGGKSIDIAKLASTQLDTHFLSLPTAASHDGIASSRASIIKNGETVSIQAEAPLCVIADTSIIMKSPYRLLAAGCGDIISNYTAVKDWRLASKLRNVYISEYAIALSEMTAQMVLESASLIKPGLEESVRLVVKALVSSSVAMSIAGSSAPASGSEHKFSHVLDRIAPKPALHGEQCGVGTIMMMYLHDGDWQSIRDALKKIGAPTTAKDLGIDDEYIIRALTEAHNVRPERYTILGDTGITYEAAVNVALATKVIS